MTSEPQRLQYLEAMGLTAWVARYALPNARPTPACEWELPEAPPAEAPGERLHALLDEAREAPPVRSAEPEAPRAQAPRAQAPRPGMARALLEEPTAQEAAAPIGAATAEPRAPQEPLRFAFQAACLEGRWLLMLAGEQPPGHTELKLLANLLRAAGIAAPLPVLQGFRWPLEEGLTVHEPLEEAREGLQAFIAGARRRGWAPERLLLFGEDEALGQVLSLDAEQCPLLDLPAWQGPALDELAVSAEAKRGLLPQLLAWGEAWRETIERTDGDR
ncbi:hypothetical protein ACM26W_17365 [Halomonas sp. HK25]|uniref:hypothetical protein n=1 Tax=Halomonas sp. HK25 TaxID=3394321 RepID=UPI0039FDB2AC